MAIFLLVLTITVPLLALWWWRRRQQQKVLACVQVVELPPDTAGGRPLWVYLPPHYTADTHVYYPLLLVNDGQDRKALQLHETLAELSWRDEIRPIIVAAIPTDENRLHEYGTAIAPNAQGLGSDANAYSVYIVNEILPLLQKSYRVSAEDQSVAFIGVSLGGLSAFDIAWHHRDRFGMAGVFSGSFWWRSAPDETVIAPDTLIMHEQVRHSAKVAGFRAWFEAGTRDERNDRDNNGVIDAIQDTQELIGELEAIGYERGEDVVYVEVEGGRHDYDTWAEVLPEFLRWAYPPRS
ncbi:MAG: alpha/beta hydrolase-fold protein [Anaerolineae bacterium]|nr:alpha/beta hydrolase-fold protein [Anaerolineae bacterium]